jgi:hypothetical protein
MVAAASFHEILVKLLAGIAKGFVWTAKVGAVNGKRAIDPILRRQSKRDKERRNSDKECHSRSLSLFLWLSLVFVYEASLSLISSHTGLLVSCVRIAPPLF